MFTEIILLLTVFPERRCLQFQNHVYRCLNITWKCSPNDDVGITWVPIQNWVFVRCHLQIKRQHRVIIPTNSCMSFCSLCTCTSQICWESWRFLWEMSGWMQTLPSHKKLWGLRLYDLGQSQGQCVDRSETKYRHDAWTINEPHSLKKDRPI